jgi:hypothetical protein
MLTYLASTYVTVGRLGGPSRLHSSIAGVVDDSPLGQAAVGLVTTRVELKGPAGHSIRAGPFKNAEGARCEFCRPWPRPSSPFR